MNALGILMVLVAWCGVWLMGTSLVLAMRTPRAWDAPGEAAWTKGAGFLLGAFVLTLWMRALSAIGIAFGILSIALPLLLLTAAALWIARRRGSLAWDALRSTIVEAFCARELDGWRRYAWLAIIAWLALRLAMLLVDVTLQPLYPWDAWIQWATKARVWFELKHIVPFVDLDRWVAAQGAFYTDSSPNYPSTVPLWQVFSCIVLGRFDDVLMNLPWWMLGLAFPIAFYGALRRMGFAALAALAGAAIIVTLPLVDVHVALAGYADLPMAAYFTLAALALLAALETRDRGDWMLALLFAIACPMIKNPGIVWLLTLAVPVVVALMPRIGVKVALAGFAVALVALLVLAQVSPTVMGYRLHLEFSPPWGALFDSLFMLGSWNILWYGVVAGAAFGARDWLAPRIAPLTMLVAAGVLFLFVVFAFTNARAWVETQTTINRAVLHLAPLIVAWTMVTFRAWSLRRDAHATVAAHDLAGAAG